MQKHNVVFLIVEYAERLNQLALVYCHKGRHLLKAYLPYLLCLQMLQKKLCGYGAHQPKSGKAFYDKGAFGLLVELDFHFYAALWNRWLSLAACSPFCLPLDSSTFLFAIFMAFSFWLIISDLVALISLTSAFAFRMSEWACSLASSSTSISLSYEGDIHLSICLSS